MRTDDEPKSPLPESAQDDTHAPEPPAVGSEPGSQVFMGPPTRVRIMREMGERVIWSDAVHDYRVAQLGHLSGARRIEPMSGKAHNHLVVDDHFVYWRDKDTHELHRMRPESDASPETIATDVGYIYSMATDGERLFWLTWARATCTGPWTAGSTGTPGGSITLR